jgi:MIP family channel proteins
MPQYFRRFVAELVGTFTLTFIGAGAIIATGGQNLVAIALAHGLALSMAVFATAHVSGGHINPAVTIAMLVTGRIQTAGAILFIAAQCAGAAIAAFALRALWPAASVDGVKLGATLGQFSQPENAGLIVGLEAALTFLLLTTIFGVAVDAKGPKNVYGFAIGLTVAMDILAGGPFSGASMNPARSFGPALVGGHWDIHWAYWVGPILGGVAAALLYDRVLLSRGEAKA